jgi:hypothetical protein
MMLGYAQYGYLMAKMIPSADVEDNGGEHPPGAGNSAANGKAGMNDI